MHVQPHSLLLANESQEGIGATGPYSPQLQQHGQGEQNLRASPLPPFSTTTAPSVVETSATARSTATVQSGHSGRAQDPQSLPEHDVIPTGVGDNTQGLVEDDVIRVRVADTQGLAGNDVIRMGVAASLSLVLDSAGALALVQRRLQEEQEARQSEAHSSSTALDTAGTSEEEEALRDKVPGVVEQSFESGRQRAQTEHVYPAQHSAYYGQIPDHSPGCHHHHSHAHHHGQPGTQAGRAPGLAYTTGVAVQLDATHAQLQGHASAPVYQKNQQQQQQHGYGSAQMSVNSESGSGTGVAGQLHGHTPATLYQKAQQQQHRYDNVDRSVDSNGGSGTGVAGQLHGYTPAVLYQKERQQEHSYDGVGGSVNSDGGRESGVAVQLRATHSQPEGRAPAPVYRQEQQQSHGHDSVDVSVSSDGASNSGGGGVGSPADKQQYYSHLSGAKNMVGVASNGNQATVHWSLQQQRDARGVGVGIGSAQVAPQQPVPHQPPQGQNTKRLEVEVRGLLARPLERLQEEQEHEHSGQPKLPPLACPLGQLQEKQEQEQENEQTEQPQGQQRATVPERQGVKHVAVVATISPFPPVPAPSAHNSSAGLRSENLAISRHDMSLFPQEQREFPYDGVSVGLPSPPLSTSQTTTPPYLAPLSTDNSLGLAAASSITHGQKLSPSLHRQQQQQYPVQQLHHRQVQQQQQQEQQHHHQQKEEQQQQKEEQQRQKEQQQRQEEQQQQQKEEQQQEQQHQQQQQPPQQFHYNQQHQRQHTQKEQQQKPEQQQQQEGPQHTHRNVHSVDNECQRPPHSLVSGALPQKVHYPRHAPPSLSAAQSEQAGSATTAMDPLAHERSQQVVAMQQDGAKQPLPGQPERGHAQQQQQQPDQIVLHLGLGSPVVTQPLPGRQQRPHGQEPQQPGKMALQLGLDSQDFATQPLPGQQRWHQHGQGRDSYLPQQPGQVALHLDDLDTGSSGPGTPHDPANQVTSTNHVTQAAHAHDLAAHVLPMLTTAVGSSTQEHVFGLHAHAHAYGLHAHAQTYAHAHTTYEIAAHAHPFDGASGHGIGPHLHAAALPTIPGLAVQVRASVCSRSHIYLCTPGWV